MSDELNGQAVRQIKVGVGVVVRMLTVFISARSTPTSKHEQTILCVTFNGVQ